MELLKTYLAERDPLILCDAAEELVGLVGQAAPSGPDEWTCSLCRHANSAGEAQCTRCRQRRLELDRTAGWQA